MVAKEKKRKSIRKLGCGKLAVSVTVTLTTEADIL